MGRTKGWMVVGRDWHKAMALWAVLLVGGAVVGACRPETADGTQLAGQECLQSPDCREGLVCVSQRCVPVSVRRDADASVVPVEDVGTDTLDALVADVGSGDATGGLDSGSPAPESCLAPGATRCQDASTRQECVAGEDGALVWQPVPCAEGQSCRDGRCLGGAGGAGGGELRCCAEGCPDGQFCHDCQCQAYDPAQCALQGQPCSQEGPQGAGFVCTRLGGESDTLRCYGQCDPAAASADGSCPERGSVCLPSEDGPSGFCLSACTLAQGCGESGQGCLPYENAQSEGVCIAARPDRALGDSCDESAALDCGEGALCVNLLGRRGQPVCTQACRPFFHEGSATDCTSGHCLVLSETLGVCTADVGRREGEVCTTSPGSCGEDGLGCYPDGTGQQRCIRICRLAPGSDDCTNGRRCIPFDASNTVLGVCR